MMGRGEDRAVGIVEGRFGEELIGRRCAMAANVANVAVRLAPAAECVAMTVESPAVTLAEIVVVETAGMIALDHRVVAPAAASVEETCGAVMVEVEVEEEQVARRSAAEVVAAGPVENPLATGEMLVRPSRLSHGRSDGQREEAKSDRRKLPAPPPLRMRMAGRT